MHQTKVIHECRFSGYMQGNVANIFDIDECIRNNFRHSIHWDRWIDSYMDSTEPTYEGIIGIIWFAVVRPPNQ